MLYFIEDDRHGNKKNFINFFFFSFFFFGKKNSMKALTILYCDLAVVRFLKVIVMSRVRYKI